MKSRGPRIRSAIWLTVSLVLMTAEPYLCFRIVVKPRMLEFAKFATELADSFARAIPLSVDWLPIVVIVIFVAPFFGHMLVTDLLLRAIDWCLVEVGVFQPVQRSRHADR